jgi:hypothetical protein
MEAQFLSFQADVGILARSAGPFVVAGYLREVQFHIGNRVVCRDGI